ncbi:tetratricopeptide repeat protein [Leptolyngbya sp. FACHB-671]|uniref:tetratricopeptide repeat protein n=1 Tax=Leptolyngbya sp. FACHB-671 TaxID=2692812 RepID=UPI001682210E|nr:tetratricopeptide repeat protein [Leptolyngbya sp. FACHB-671]MBD2069380.1 tetratricopeptide repeat protein [Leptolyngbya sp. FACHB-671]
MASLSDALAIAHQHYQSGRLAEAEQAYRQILAEHPDYTEVWHFLGMTFHQAGRLLDAMACYQRALSFKPDNPFVHNNLGVAHRAQGQFDLAIAHYQQALALKPSYPEVHNNLGNLFRQTGDLEQAIAHYQQAISLAPRYAEAHNNLGMVRQDQGEFEQAIAHYQQALTLKPNNADIHNNLGNALQGLKKFEAAIACYQKALALQPENFTFYNNLGAALQELGQLTKSVQVYRQALTLKPDYVDAHYNLGNTLKDLKKLDECVTCYRQAIALKPDYADAYNNLGLALCEQGKIAESVAAYQQAISLQPDYADAHLNRGLSLLLAGELAQGFEEYEWRWQVKGPNFKSLPAFTQPMWDGSYLNGKTILLHTEQGFGDTIQFIRYAPLIAERGGRVIVECQEALIRLLQTVPEINQVIAKGTPLPEFHVHAPLLSLPHIFGTTLNTIPAQIPYLKAPASDLHLDAPPDRFKVGIVWAGSPDHRSDRDRSCSLNQFVKLLEVPNVQLYSLQKGARTADLTQLPNASTIEDLSPQLKDFADTAAAMMQLDLIITVDTSVGHLAGALGRPVWVLLSFAADWRWMCDRSDSPWYPTLRLFRQPTPGDWDSVLTETIQTLKTKTLRPQSPTPDPQPPASTPQPSAPSLHSIGIGWELSAATGWGIYGTNLTLQLLKTREFKPITLLPPFTSADFNPLHQALLSPLFNEPQRIEQILQQNPGKALKGNFLLLKALGNQFETTPKLERVSGKHNVGVIFFEDTQLSQTALARANSYDLILAGSSWNTEVLKSYGCNPVCMVPQGIDPTIFHPAPRSGVLGDRFVIFSGGKLEYRKGQDIVIKAFRIFHSRHPEALLLTAWHNFWPQTMIELEQAGHVAGLPKVSSDGRLQIQNWLADNGIPTTACMDVGLIPNHLVGQILREADVAVFPNRCEGGTNLAAMESLACGVPTILSANTGHLDLIDENHCYSLKTQGEVKPTQSYSGVAGWGEPDPEELVEALEAIYTNRQEAYQRGINATHFMQDWTWEKQVGRLLEVIKPLL